MNAVKNFFSSCKTHSSKIALIVSIVGIICLLSGTSYALFNSTVTGTKKQVVQTGKVKLQVTEPASGLSLDEMNEYTDVEGLLQDDYYEFSVKNIGDAPVSYKLYLLDDADKMVTYEGGILDDKFIRVGIERNGEELGPLSLLEANRLVDAAKINIGVANEYRVRTWLNFDDATYDELDAMEGEYTKFLKVKVVAEQTFDDLDAPTCTISSLLNNDGNSATLTVTSTDTDLADAPYSWDKKTYSIVNTKEIFTNGTYVAYMKDINGNVGSCSIDVSIPLKNGMLAYKILGANNANVVSSGDGLYVSTATNDGEPTYYYTGAVTNNYVAFDGLEEGNCLYNNNIISTVWNYSTYSSSAATESTCGTLPVCNNNGTYVLYSAGTCPGTALGVVADYVYSDALWRVVRINEDGTIRIIMQNGINKNATYQFHPSGDVNYENM